MRAGLGIEHGWSHLERFGVPLSTHPAEHSPQPFEESLPGQPSDSQCRVEQPVDEPKEKTPDVLSVSSEDELANLHVLASTMFFYMFLKIRTVKLDPCR